MTEVRVIARAVARKGNEDRVKALLQRVRRGGAFIFTNCGKVRLRLSNTQQALTISTWN